MSQLEALCETLKIHADSKYIGNTKRDGWECIEWRVTLRWRQGDKRRTLTVPFYQGLAHTREPSAADVLYCLVSDARSYQDARSFEDWCGDFGYDVDSRKAEATWRECGKLAPRVKRFLGFAFDRVADAEH